MLKGIAIEPAAASGLTIGTSQITNGTNTRVLFDDNGVVGESSGLTYTKATGLLTPTALAVTSAGTAGAPTLSISNATTGFYSVSTTGLGISVGGTSRADYGITTASVWTVNAKLTVASGSAFQLGNAATTGLVAGTLAALTNATIVILDSGGQAYRVPCII